MAIQTMHSSVEREGQQHKGRASAIYGNGLTRGTPPTGNVSLVFKQFKREAAAPSNSETFYRAATHNNINKRASQQTIVLSKREKEGALWQ